METVTFAGWDQCLRLANGDVEVIVSTTFGPRVLFYGLHGGPNAFALCPHLSVDLGNDQWKPYGGHRLWTAPEALPRSYFPDNGPIGSVHLESGVLHLSSLPEQTTGIQKEISLQVAAEGSGVRVTHQLTNTGVWPVTLSVWGLSIVANGGYVVLPQEPFASHDDTLLPARPVVLWPFTDMADARWRWGTRYVTLRQTETPAGKPQKVGIYNTAGWAAHVTPQQVFIIHTDAAEGGPTRYPDQGSNFETYTDGSFQELETLSPLHTLEPGQSVQHIETWFLAPLPNLPDRDDALDTDLLPLISQTRHEITNFS